MLPKMSETETKELDRILSVQLPKNARTEEPKNPIGDIDHPHRGFLRHMLEHKRTEQPKNERTNELKNVRTEERKNERTNELKNARTEEPVRRSIGSFVRQSPPLAARRPDIIPSAPIKAELVNISHLSAADLRKPPSIYVCLENLRKQIDRIVDGGHTSSGEALAAFEKSPLHRDYLQTGIRFINHDETAPLSHEEFEALTDFRSSLKKIT